MNFPKIDRYEKINLKKSLYKTIRNFKYGSNVQFLISFTSFTKSFQCNNELNN